MSNYNISQTSLSFLSSILPNSTANTIIGASILTAATALIIHLISPTRMTRVLVALMHENSLIYIRAIEAGLVSSDVDVDALFHVSLACSIRHFFPACRAPYNVVTVDPALVPASFPDLESLNVPPALISPRQTLQPLKLVPRMSLLTSSIS
ncbi:hypothetical protein C8J57DRAFT_1519951 [Mycena rebaudengoi]|nr:hypothetical protein C8J57DRAFT_1519951 [Mycena rebaudengoi]